MNEPARKSEVSRIYPNYNTNPTPEQRKEDWKELLGPDVKDGKTEEGYPKITGTCPSCGKLKECYVIAYGSNSGAWWQQAKCNRVDKCGYIQTHRKQFPEQYGNFIERFNRVNPNRQFDQLDDSEKIKAYLIERGFSENMIDGLDPSLFCIEEQSIEGIKLGECVMFRFADGQYLNGRAINPPDDAPSKHYTKGGAGASYFRPFDLKQYDHNKTVYLAESPIKALTHVDWGNQIISLYSAKKLTIDHPIFTDFKGYKIAVALDNDTNGAAQKVLREIDELLNSPEAKALGITAGKHIQPFIAGKGWDDLLKEGKKWADIQQKCEDSASLALAKTAQDWLNRSVEIRTREETKGRFYYIPPVFEFGGVTYLYTHIETTSSNPEIHKAELCCEATFKIEATVIHDLKHSWRLRITEPNGETEVITVEASQLKGEGLETFLLERSIIYKPKPQSWKILVGHLLKRQSIPRAVQLDYVGYHLESGSYLFPSWGISKDGKLLTPNEFGAYEVDIEGQKKYFIPSQNVKMLEAKPSDFKTQKERIFILESFLCQMGKAYPKTIGIMISHQLATLYCPLIKEESYGVPFYAIKGPKGTGKTESVKCLLEAFGLKVEGISLVSSNEKAVRRELSHLSGALYYYDETNDEEPGSRSSRAIKDHESKMLPCYGKSTIHAQGEKNTGNSIHKSYYRGNQIYTYNFSPWKTEAFRSRLIESKVIPELLTKDSRDAYRQWKELEIPRNRQLAGIAFLEATIKPFADSWQSEIKEARKFLDEHHPTSSQRTLENFQIILAANRILKKVFSQLKDHPSLDLEVPYDGEETPKIHILVEQHERRCNTNDSSALKTLVNALNDIGAIDMSRKGGRPEAESNNDIFQWGDDGLKVYLQGMVNNENGDKVLRSEKKEIEQELHRVEGASQKKIKIWGRLQSGWLLTTKALETIIGITDGDDRD